MSRVLTPQEFAQQSESVLAQFWVHGLMDVLPAPANHYFPGIPIAAVLAWTLRSDGSQTDIVLQGVRYVGYFMVPMNFWQAVATRPDVRSLLHNEVADRSAQGWRTHNEQQSVIGLAYYKDKADQLVASVPGVSFEPGNSWWYAVTTLCVDSGEQATVALLRKYTPEIQSVAPNRRFAALLKAVSTRGTAQESAVVLGAWQLLTAGGSIIIGPPPPPIDGTPSGRRIDPFFILFDANDPPNTEHEVSQAITNKANTLEQSVPLGPQPNANAEGTSGMTYAAGGTLLAGLGLLGYWLYRKGKK